MKRLVTKECKDRSLFNIGKLFYDKNCSDCEGEIIIARLVKKLPLFTTVSYIVMLCCFSQRLSTDYLGLPAWKYTLVINNLKLTDHGDYKVSSG